MLDMAVALMVTLYPTRLLDMVDRYALKVWAPDAETTSGPVKAAAESKAEGFPFAGNAAVVIFILLMPLTLVVTSNEEFGGLVAAKAAAVERAITRSTATMFFFML